MTCTRSLSFGRCLVVYLSLSSDQMSTKFLLLNSQESYIQGIHLTGQAKISTYQYLTETFLSCIELLSSSSTLHTLLLFFSHFTHNTSFENILLIGLPTKIVIIYLHHAASVLNNCIKHYLQPEFLTKLSVDLLFCF